MPTSIDAVRRLLAPGLLLGCLACGGAANTSSAASDASSSGVETTGPTATPANANVVRPPSLQLTGPACASYGTFGTAVSIPAGLATFAVAVGDVTGDGNIDIVASPNGAVNQLVVLAGGGDGSFAAATSVAWPESPKFALAIADFNRDGNLDVAALGGSLSLALGKGAGSFAAATRYLSVPSGLQVVAADVDWDGNIDVVSSQVAGGTYSVALGNANGLLRVQAPAASGAAHPVGLAVANLTGYPGLIFGDQATGNIFSLPGQCTGAFSQRGAYAAGNLNDTTYLAVADFDLDGRPDVGVASVDGAGQLTVLFGSLDGSFGGSITLPGSLGSYSDLAVADVDGDGLPDLVGLVTAAPTTPAVRVVRNAGNRSFAAPVDYPVGIAPARLALADFDNDGALDIVTSERNGSGVNVLLNTGCLQ